MHIVYKLIFEKRKESYLFPFQYIGTKSNCQVVDGVILDSKNRPYYGSSKYRNYSTIVKDNKDGIRVEIMYIGSSYRDCLLKERDLQIENDVVMSPEYFNNMIAIDTIFHDPDYVMMKNIISGKCCRIHKDHSDIVNGLWVGVSTGSSWYNNGIETKTFLLNDVPDGWVKGRLWDKPAHNKGKPASKIHVQKGVATRMANGSYTGYNKGKTGRPASDETKLKMSISRKGKRGTLIGRRWITNGIKNTTILADEIPPEGWAFGQTKSPK